MKDILENSLCRIESFRKLSGLGYYGLNKLDREIRKFIPSNHGFFVELGANDGIRQSNTFSFEKYLGYRGVLIEPYPENFIKCVENRSSKNFFFNGACVSFGYTDKQMTLLYSNLMTTPLQGEVDIENREEHAYQGEKFLKGGKPFTFKAQVGTLTEILILAAAPRTIELLSLDVEGGEIEVLKGVDHERFRFKVICLECRDLDAMREYLESNGYRLSKKISHHDYIFVDTREPARISP
jgi:FkbM family methyltransferase